MQQRNEPSTWSFSVLCCDCHLAWLCLVEGEAGRLRTPLYTVSPNANAAALAYSKLREREKKNPHLSNKRRRSDEVVWRKSVRNRGSVYRAAPCASRHLNLDFRSTLTHDNAPPPPAVIPTAGRWNITAAKGGNINNTIFHSGNRGN